MTTVPSIAAVAPKRLPAAKVLVSSFYFFCLLCSYYLLRPLRDEIGVSTGVENLPWLFTGTFVTMLGTAPLFGWAASRFRVHELVSVVYGFFAANLLIFWVLLRLQSWAALAAPAFFIWLSVFNLCVVSMFWSVMASIFREGDARRRFPPIAAGGSIGAIAGPSMAVLLSRRIDPPDLILFSATFLLLGMASARWLSRSGAQKTTASISKHRADHQPYASPRLAPSNERRGGILDGFTLTVRHPLLRAVSALVICYTTISTFLYFQQAEILSATVGDSGQRAAYFASIDLAVNAGSILLQLAGTSALLVRFGVGATLVIVPVLIGGGLAALAGSPSLTTLAIVQVAHRVGNFAITRPGREVLFTIVDRPARYQAKNFVDTTVFRGSDAVSAWGFAGLRSLGMAAAGIAWVGVGMAILWASVAFITGRRHDAQTRLAGE